MRIAVLSDPNNFHTQKWAKALQNAGAEVVVVSYESYSGSDLTSIQLRPPLGRNGKYSYLDYLRGGKVLRKALEAHKIDLVNPLNITPFGVWAMKAGVKPAIGCAFGADILEYPPTALHSQELNIRGWDAKETQSTSAAKWLQKLKRQFYRKKVAESLNFMDLITGDNQYLVDCMRNWFSVSEEKLRLLRWGVEPELFVQSSEALDATRQRSGIQDGQIVILSPRGAKPLYQADIILEAFAQLLAQNHPNVQMIMLGAGYLVSEKVRQKAEKLMESYSNFHFVGEALPREALYALWNFVDIFISAPIYDGYSAALAEGRYIGAIPLVNDIPANRELINHGQNGWISSPFTATQLSLDLEYLLENRLALKPQFAVSNRKWIEENSLMHENAVRFLEACETLLRH